MKTYSTKSQADREAKILKMGEEVTNCDPLHRWDYRPEQMGGTNAEGNPITFYAIKIYDERGTEVAYW
jgi:hypothetical protein